MLTALPGGCLVQGGSGGREIFAGFVPESRRRHTICRLLAPLTIVWSLNSFVSRLRRERIIGKLQTRVLPIKPLGLK